MTSPLRVGIAGLGTVGASVLRLLASRREALQAATGRAIDVVAVSARDRSRDRNVDLAGAVWHDDPAALVDDPGVDLVVELIGGANGIAKALVERALGAGKGVVTANKALLAEHGMALARLAEARGVPLAFEAAAAGGIPIVKTLREGLPGNNLTRISGILNGTCNFILTQMEKKALPFADCLAEAQRLGYAEADPTFDIGGFDTAHKLAILASLAFGSAVDADAVYVEGIASIDPVDLAMAEELGYRIKLLGVAMRTGAGIEQRVHPTMVPKSSAIAQVMGVTNAVSIEGDAVGELTLIGPGAGGGATASAVVADIADIARGARQPPFGIPADRLERAAKTPMQRHAGGYYIRLSVVDRPGAIAAIATRMAERQISLDSVLQRGPPSRGRQEGAASSCVPVVLITHATTEAAVRDALDAICGDGPVQGTPQVIRIEKE